MQYFKSDGNYIYLEAPAIEFYIPKYYFDPANKFAESLRDTVRTLGVFDVGIFDNGKLIEMRVLNLPTWVDLFVYDSDERTMKLPNEEENTVCVVLKYIKGEKIMASSIVQDSSNVESYVNFTLKGKVPTIVPYEKSLQIWKKNQLMNNASLGVPDVMQELILSVSYRYKKDPGKKFSHVIGKNPTISQYDYVMNNIRQICQYTSTFTALTFEDIDSMITTSLNRTRNKGEEAYSPIESLIKM